MVGKATVLKYRLRVADPVTQSSTSRVLGLLMFVFIYENCEDGAAAQNAKYRLDLYRVN